MSKIYNLNPLADRYQDNNFKEREIRAFTTKFPEARIIQDHYPSERQLEDDWQKYCELPYHLKVLCNERCLRLYGVKNEQQYIRLKSEFSQKDIGNADILSNKYVPQGFIQESESNPQWLIKQAKDYMDKGGHSILLIDYDNLKDLNNDWYNFNNQCYEHKVIANNKSLEIYGKTVPEVYRNEVKKFLVKDISNSSLDDLDLKPIVSDSLSATEAVVDEIRDSMDLIEQVMLLEMAKSQISTPVENSIIDQITEQVEYETWLQEDMLGRYNFLLPWEVIGLFENAEELLKDEMFINYYARGIGLKPKLENYQMKVKNMLETEKSPENLLKVGWNPVFSPLNEENLILASSRANQLMNSYCNYRFLDYTHTPNLLTEDELEQPFHKGISIIMIQELDKENIDVIDDLPKVLVTLDYREPSWYPLLYGRLLGKQSVDGIIRQFSQPCVTLYFIELSDYLYDKVRSTNLDEFNDANEIQRVCTLLQLGAPHVANKKLFLMFLLNSIIYSKFGEYPFCPRFNTAGNPDMVHLLYSKLNGTYNDILQSFSKLGVFDKDKANLQEAEIFRDMNLIVDLNENINPTFNSKSLVKPNYSEIWSDFAEILNTPVNI